MILTTQQLSTSSHTHSTLLFLLSTSGSKVLCASYYITCLLVLIPSYLLHQISSMLLPALTHICTDSLDMVIKTHGFSYHCYADDMHIYLIYISTWWLYRFSSYLPFGHLSLDEGVPSPAQSCENSVLCNNCKPQLGVYNTNVNQNSKEPLGLCLKTNFLLLHPYFDNGSIM